MRKSHAHLVHQKGLSDHHFDAIAQHLNDALNDLDVPIEQKDQIMDATTNLKDAVLDRDGGGEFDATSTGLATDTFRQMVDAMPVAVMVADLVDFKINYMNKVSLDTLRSIEHLLPVKADAMIGQCIDIFHKDPGHQRRMLADPGNLPHKAIIQVGDEKLDLLVTPVYDQGGAYTAAMVTWSVVTDKLRMEEESLRQAQMIDQMPVNVMFMEPENFTITYMNQTSLDTLGPLADLLLVPPEQIVGQCVDIFHKDPSHQRKILSDPKNLPYNARIRLGEHTLNLRVNAVSGSDGRYMGAMLSWSVITGQVALADNFETDIKAIVQAVSAASTEMQASAEALTATAEEASGKANTVAAASEELTSSIREITQQVSRSATISSDAVNVVKNSSEQIQGLATSADKIGDVVGLITDIASQTNLLALNATIEAARAGEAGKGFAVVASEVKNLASQTAKATDEISAQITAIQESTRDAVNAISEISKTIDEQNEIATAIASAVEEQGAATQEVASNISAVTSAAGETGHSATQVLEAANELSQQSEKLGAESDAFLVEMRKL